MILAENADGTVNFTSSILVKIEILSFMSNLYHLAGRKRYIL